MNKNARKYVILICMLLLIPLTFLLVFSKMDHNFTTLPYYGKDGKIPAEKAVEMDSTAFYTIPEFELTDENGNSFHSDSLKGDVWIAAFYTTSSPYISKITKRLLGLNFTYNDQSDIKLVVFSTEPSFDKPKVLRSYLDEIKSAPEKWKFLTGEEEKVADVIQNGFLIDDYKNTSTLWLVDNNGHLRGKFNGNSEEEVKDATEAIALLKKEIDVKAYEERKAREN
ncbi:SCO family protein [Halocola ammonii]